MTPNPVTWGDVVQILIMIGGLIMLYLAIAKHNRGRDDRILAEVEKASQEIHSVRQEGEERARRLYDHLNGEFVRKDVHAAEVEGLKHALEEQTATITSAIGALERLGTAMKEGNGK